jgi:hypothetical protein
MARSGDRNVVVIGPVLGGNVFNGGVTIVTSTAPVAATVAD